MLEKILKYFEAHPRKATVGALFLAVVTVIDGIFWEVFWNIVLSFLALAIFIATAMLIYDKYKEGGWRLVVKCIKDIAAGLIKNLTSKDLLTPEGDVKVPRSSDLGTDRTVYRRVAKKWANKRNDASRPSSLHDTQQEAENQARKNLRNQGGGELTTIEKDEKTRSKDTIPPGRSHFPSRDTES